MTAISSSTPVHAPMTAHAAASDAGSGDDLAAMRGSMNSAFAIGTPSDAAGASGVLATGTSYIAGAQATITRIEDGIASKTRALETLAEGGGSIEEIQQAGEQIELLQRLRDRIRLSIERVGDILAGKDRDDIGGPESNHGDDAAAEEARRRREDEERLRAAAAESRRSEEAQLLEQRRQLLAGTAAASLVAPVPSSAVASTYHQGSTPG